jgi:CBS domain-containing protein
MDHDVPKLSVDTSLIEAQEQLARSKSQVAAVYEDLQFVGLLSFDDIERAFYAFSSRGGIRPQTA